MYGARLLVQEAVGNFKGITLTNTGQVTSTATTATNNNAAVTKSHSSNTPTSNKNTSADVSEKVEQGNAEVDKSVEEAYEKDLMARVMMATNPQAAAAAAAATAAATALTTPTSTTAAPVLNANQRTITKSKVVMPTPVFVMKSKKANGEKVFINVCYHKDVQDDNIYLSPVKQFADKTGGSSAVYDAVIGVTTNSLEDLNVQETLGHRIITMINEKYEQKLELQFTTPKTKNDYKGDVVTETNISYTVVEEIKVKLERNNSVNGTSGVTNTATNGGDQFITPTPGVVIKCKNSSTNMKIFINVCMHELIPNKERPVLLTGPSRNYSVMGEDTALIYDAVVNPKTLNSITQLKDASLKDAKLKEVR